MQRQPSEMGCECKYGMKASLGQQLLASVAVMPSSKAVRRVGRRAGGEPGSAITNSPPLYHERDGDSSACPHAGDIANTPRAGLRSFKVPTTLPPERGLKPLEMQSNPHHSHQTRNASNDGSAEFSNSRSTAEAAESEGGVRENHETPMVCLPTVYFPEVDIIYEHGYGACELFESPRPRPQRPRRWAPQPRQLASSPPPLPELRSVDQRAKPHRQNKEFKGRRQ